MKAARLSAMAVAASALALALAGCLLPPFNLDLSLAYRSASRMKQVVEIGPVEFWRGNAVDRDFCFLPSQTPFTTGAGDLGVSHGLLVSAGDYSLQVWYLDADTSGSNAGVYGERQFVVDNTNGDHYNWRIFMLKGPVGGSSDYLLVHDWSDAGSAGPGLVRLRYDRGANLSEDLTSASWTAVGTSFSGSLIGLSFHPLNSTSADEMALIQTGGGEYFSNVTYTGWTSFGTRSPTIAGSPLNGFYYHDPATTRSVLSWNQAGSFVTYAWDDFTYLTPVQVPVTERIDAVLSDGELYHRGDGSDTVYGADGRKKHEFPVGDLRFVGERYVAGVPMLFYTLAYWEAKSSGNDKMRVRVYTIPTADLGDLD